MGKNCFRLALIFLAAAFSTIEVPAQIPLTKEASPKILDPYAERLCKSHLVSIAVTDGDIIAGVQARLKELNPDLKANFSGFALQNDITSPGGRHLTFEQTYSGFPVFQSQIKVNLNKENRIKSVFDNSWDVSSWDKIELKTQIENLDLESVENYFRGIHSGDKTDVRIRKVLAVLNNEPVALVEVELWDNVTNEHLLLLANNAFEIFLRRDMNRYHTSEIATAKVFNPDPLSTAHVIKYGSPYVDDSNREVTALNDQRVSVDLEVTLDSGVYKLENQYVRMDEYSGPSVPPVTSTSPVFDFTRGQSGFEDVNVFYHLTRYRHYVDTLGFPGLVDIPILADAHAINGADNSMFTPHVLGPRLFFGEGGVDDAEDADVAVHENGHALADRASPSSNNGTERNSVDEGIGDYFAASYSMSLDSFRWQKVFNWDGSGEYWGGRYVNTDKNYIDDYESGGSIHKNGEIYSGALATIMKELGQNKGDKLVLQHLYFLAQNMSMKNAAMLLYDADTVLYNGANFCVIYNALLERNLTDTFSTDACVVLDSSVAAKAGDDKSVCFGDSVTIGDATALKDTYFYQWTPPTGLGSPLSLITNAAPRQNTTYILTASRFSGAYNLDTVTIEVLQCDILFLNTEGFISGENLTILLPYNSNDNSIEVFDALGRRLYAYFHLTEKSYTFDGSLLPAGGYIFRVKATSGQREQKVVKLR